MINEKKINAVNISQRKTLIRRKDIDALFEKQNPDYEIVIRPVEKTRYSQI
jgi:Fe-S cluster biosynthesis and repair protein YggX